MSALPAANQEREDADALASTRTPAGALVRGDGGSQPDLAVKEAVGGWLVRLSAAGLACRGVALHASDPRFNLPFDKVTPEMATRWALVQAQLNLGSPVRVARAEAAGGDLLVASVLQMPDGQLGAIGVALAPPYSDRSVQQVLLGLGWLQLALSAPRVDSGLRAGKLLELMGHAASQRRARSAAQEWINRTSGWVREMQGEAHEPLTLMLFEVRNGQPRWWVTADAAWTEKAAPGVQAATEVATQAVAEQQELQLPQAWALPVLGDGEVQAVLVAQRQAATCDPLPADVYALLRASAALAEPLLRQWRLAERPLWRHALHSTVQVGHKLCRPGHLSWKFGSVAVVAALLGLLAWPVPDRINANSVIEGQQRLLVTAPFDGFLGQVLVRPGVRVTRGQVLAQLDDRDLRLEQGRYRSEREQAAGRLRQAMAERDAPALALATAEVQQAEAQLQLVEAKLVRSQLVAPQDGLVVNGDWAQQIGSPVEIGKEMFELASGEGYRVVLHVPDRDIARVQPGQRGVLRLTGQPHTVHEFRVSTVTATASVQDGTNGFRVEAEWLGATPALSPGMQGVGKVEVGQDYLFTIWTRSSIDWLRLKWWSWWW